MNKLIKIIMMTTILSLSSLYGHGGGHGTHNKKEVSKSYIQRKATQEVLSLVKNKRIDTSWSNKPILNIVKTKYNHNDEWVISFNNLDIKDKTKQTIYIFISTYGDVKGANYTGK